MKSNTGLIQQDTQYCLEVLPKVSRTFAPTIRLLPKGLEVPVTVAYLLCRIADTIEDSPYLSLQEKDRMLSLFSHLFLDNQFPEAPFWNEVSAFKGNTADDELVRNARRIFAVFRTFSPILQKHIGKWVVEMSHGMQHFAQSSFKPRFSFLKSMQDLDEYTYYVAGTVGYLLTELFYFYSSKITPRIKQRLEQLAESFGKGLQLVNIIRDMTTDLRRGQSYIPDELLKKYELTRSSIFEKENAAKAEMMFNELIENAVKHLDRALDYILLIPKEETRIRLFCMLPLFWALRTLEKIQKNTLALLGSEKIKISRSLIRKEYFLAIINMNSNRLTRWHYHNIRKAVTPILVA
ncbi:MAG TPA: phytoene/squalene synthase family protein [Calditrichaeota bacterium]|nr:phytoene/squalene synthase family protein [Calditrichota bacterium]